MTTYADADAILAACPHPDHEVVTDRIHRRCACYQRYWDVRKQARKEQLAAEPRCEVPTCNRRGAKWAMGVLTCTAHFDRAQAAHRRFTAAHPMVLFMTAYYPRDQWLRMAQER